MSGRLSKIDEWEPLARQSGFRPAAMAALCHVSLRQVERHFDLQFETTPGCWLRALQCRLAKELVSQGYSNKAAASELKFANESHFCREFKKIFGVPPQTFAPGWNPAQKVAFRQECRH
jgi:AraC-like DNA-binding protein